MKISVGATFTGENTAVRACEPPVMRRRNNTPPTTRHARIPASDRDFRADKKHLLPESIAIALNRGSESHQLRFWADFIMNMSWHEPPRSTRFIFCGEQGIRWPKSELLVKIGSSGTWIIVPLNTTPLPAKRQGPEIFGFRTQNRHSSQVGKELNLAERIPRFRLSTTNSGKLSIVPFEQETTPHTAVERSRPHLYDAR